MILFARTRTSARANVPPLPCVRHHTTEQSPRVVNVRANERNISSVSSFFSDTRRPRGIRERERERSMSFALFFLPQRIALISTNAAAQARSVAVNATRQRTDATHPLNCSYSSSCTINDLLLLVNVHTHIHTHT